VITEEDGQMVTGCAILAAVAVLFFLVGAVVGSGMRLL
jgi:hypothetical protein